MGATSSLILRTLSCSSLHTPSTDRPFVPRNSYYGPKHSLYKQPPPASDATARANDDIGDMPALPMSHLISRHKVVDID